MKKETVDREYSTVRVPESDKKSFMELLVVWIGYVFVVTGMQVGGTMGGSLDFATLLESIAIGSVILFVLGSFMGLIAIKTRLTFGMLCRYAFGKIGATIISIIVVFTLVGWFAVDAYMIGQATNALFPVVPIMPVAVIAGIAMTATALFGMKWMSKLSDIAVPLVLIFGVVSIILSVKGVGGVSGLFAIRPDAPITLNDGISLAIGSFVCGAVAFTPDVFRFAKSAGHVIGITAVAMLLANPLMMILGAVGAIATGNSDITFVLAAQGLLAPAFICMVLNIWSTAQGDAYSGSLCLASIVNVKRSWLVIGFGAVGTIGAVVGFYNYFSAFISFLASTFPALGGVFIADFLVRYRKGYPDLESYKAPAVGVGGFIAWGLGIAATYLPFGIASIDSILVAFAAQALIAVVEERVLAARAGHSVKTA